MNPASCAQALATFLERLPAGGRIGVVCHSDADGLSSGAILTRGLRTLGYTVEPMVTRKFENPWDLSLRERLPAGLDALVVSDSGIRPEPLRAGLPTCFIDHHHYTEAPPESIVISGFGMEPTPTSSLLAWWSLPNALQPPLLWLAALGLIGDLGEKAPFPELAAAKADRLGTALRKVTSLLNAFRRSASADHEVGLSILLGASGPKEVLRPDLPEAGLLQAAKVEVDAALATAKKVGPKVKGDAALILIDTPCQIHSLVAQLWRFRLADKVVICANTGYHPGWVHFSARSALPWNLIDFLRRFTPEGAGENFARGHAQATGGSLPLPVWEDFRQRLGYPTPAAPPA